MDSTMRRIGNFRVLGLDALIFLEKNNKLQVLEPRNKK